MHTDQGRQVQPGPRAHHAPISGWKEADRHDLQAVPEKTLVVPVRVTANWPREA